MLMIAAAVAVTLVVTTLEDKSGAPGPALSLRDAIERANSEPGPHVITFAKKATGYHYMASALTINAPGKLTIDGDIDDDGLADVVLLNGYAEKFIVKAGADVTIIGVDLYGGNAVGKNGALGGQGTDGGQGPFGVRGGLDAATDKIVPPTDGSDGGDGKSGKNGTRGENAAGVIHNFGKLKLVRLGISNGYAVAGYGGAGGFGGRGGAAGWGGDGLGSGAELSVSQAIVQDGAKGAGGGDGADGGDGGNGGSAAGGVLNEASGELELVDVSFGGRLGGWLVARNSTAIAAFGGSKGLGGGGGSGGRGGRGGSATYVASIAATFDWTDGSAEVLGAAWGRFTNTGPGSGGAGGRGGARGNDGRFGLAGDAASAVLNLGASKGAAAIGGGGKVTAGPGRSVTAEPLITGKGGGGGPNGGRRAPTFSYCSQIESLNNPSFTAAALAVAPGDHRLDLPPDKGHLPAEGFGPSGADGADGLRVLKGRAGRAKNGVLNAKDGSGAVETAGSLVFVHPLGVQMGKKGARDTLDFNVIRLGKSDGTMKVAWKILEPAKGAAVEPRVFGKRALPSGAVKFLRIPADAKSDVDNSVKRVSLPIDLAKLEGPAGYRIAIAIASGKDAILGTEEVTGRLKP